jgi:hypothetical protein
MRCRSHDIRQQAIGDGLWPGGGEGVAWVCDACGHIGPPLLVPLTEEVDTRREAAWEREYDSAEARIRREDRASRWTSERRKRARNARLLAACFFIVAAVFLLPAAAIMTESMRHTSLLLLPAAVAVVLGDTWLFVAVGVVLLVMAMRKIDDAAKIDAEKDEKPAPET